MVFVYHRCGSAPWWSLLEEFGEDPPTFIGAVKLLKAARVIERAGAVRGWGPDYLGRVRYWISEDSSRAISLRVRAFADSRARSV